MTFNKEKNIDRIISINKEKENLINELVENFLISYIDDICEKQNIKDLLKFEIIEIFTKDIDGVDLVIRFETENYLLEKNEKTYYSYSSDKLIYNNFVNYIQPISVDDLSFSFTITIKDFLIKKEKFDLENNLKDLNLEQKNIINKI